MRDINLEDRREDREILLKNTRSIEVLDKTKKILMIGNTDFMTVHMVAEYYEVEYDVIKHCINRNKEELVENGLIQLKGAKVKEKFVGENVSLTNFRGYFEADGRKFANGNNTLINKRVLLNIGMLLRDSEVAKELRRRLLDIVQDSENGEGSIDTIVGEITEEMKLKVRYVDAMMNGDISKMNEINAKLFELKNKRIKELEVTNEKLEETITDIVETNMSYDTLRRELVANLQNISRQCYNSDFKKAYGDFYKFLYESGYRLESRRTKMLRKIMDITDDLDIEKMELQTKLSDLSDLLKEDKSYKKEVTLTKGALRDKKRELKQTLRDYNRYEKCSKLSLIKEYEYEDIVKITRSWALAKGYDWREGLVKKEDIDLPF